MKEMHGNSIAYFVTHLNWTPNVIEQAYVDSPWRPQPTEPEENTQCI